jgi:TonB family protein
MLFSRAEVFVMAKPLGIFLTAVFVALCIGAFAQDSTETPNPSTLASLKDADVTPPRQIHAPDPKYPAESRRAGIQGSSWISMMVGTDGVPHDLKVVRKLDDALDEKALETVRSWRYKPATKNDHPVEVEVVAKILFRLKGENYQKIGELWERSDAADPKAEWALYKAYRDGAGVPQDEQLAMWFLKRAADWNLPEAQFQMGEHFYENPDGPRDCVSAYMWYALSKRAGGQEGERRLKVLAGEMTPEQLSEAEVRVGYWPENPPKDPQ